MGDDVKVVRLITMKLTPFSTLDTAYKENQHATGRGDQYLLLHGLEYFSEKKK